MRKTTKTKYRPVTKARIGADGYEISSSTAIPPAEPKCLNPHCTRKVHTRGLCKHCYHMARTLVVKGKTTWAKLEKAGRVLAPSKTCSAGIGTTKWLLNGE